MCASPMASRCVYDANEQKNDEQYKALAALEGFVDTGVNT